MKTTTTKGPNRARELKRERQRENDAWLKGGLAPKKSKTRPKANTLDYYWQNINATWP